MVQNSVPLPHGAVFYPTREQFADPIKYIARYEPTASGFHLPLLFKWTLGFSIEHEAARTGICKIVPPRGWNPTFAIDLEDDHVHFDTRKQKIHELQEGRAYGKGRTHTFKSFREDADAFRKRWFSSRGLDPTTTTSDEVAQEYWRVVQMGGPRTEVEYANDLDIAQVGSGFLRSSKRFASQATKGIAKLLPLLAVIIATDNR
uniref:JmjN domain-containing protein n=1 Tax=Hyaloperonospora arabidopsidis (strain Emoy2) TaxID=559515 RepID=M4BIH9_HYAAE